MDQHGPINEYDRRGIMLTLLFIVSVFLLSLNNIYDWDAWLHLSMGKAIFEQRGIPLHEPYVYTLQGQGFGYSSWLFGLIYYTVYRFFNLYGVILLNASVITAAFYLLFKDALRPHKNYITAIVIMTAVIFVSRYRFVERPDTFLMVFLAFSIFSLNAFMYDNKKYIYALPLVHLLWANSHTSVILMVVPFLAFIGGGTVQLIANRFYKRRHTERLFAITPSISGLVVVALIFVVSYGATLITPYYSKGQVVSPQVVSGVQFMAVDWYKQEIQELLAPTWETYKVPYVFTALVLFSFVVSWFVSLMRFRNRSVGRGCQGLPPLMHFFLILPFIYLAFTARRFGFLLAMVSGPLIARNMAVLFVGAKASGPMGDTDKGKSFLTTVGRTGIALWLVLFTALTLARVGPFNDKEQIFGFGINYGLLPEGALKYMDKRNISGRILNLYQWGQYIIWRDFPKRAPFIDGRGLGSGELLEKMNIARNDPPTMDELQKRYGFEAILMDYPRFPENASYEAFSDVDFIAHPGWALVYWDDLSVLYLRRGGAYDSVIRKDEYRYIKPVAANTFYDIGSRLHDADYRTNVIEELKRNISETGSSRAYAFLGYVYDETGHYREAIEALSKVRDTSPMSFLPQAYSGIGLAYDKLGNTDESIEYMKKSLSLNDNQPFLYYLIGTAYIKKNDNRTAVKYLEKAVKLNRNLFSIYPILTGLYQELGMSDAALKAKEEYENVKVVSEGEKHFNAGIKEYLAGRRQEAEAEFKQSIASVPSNPASYSNLGYIYYDKGDLETSFKYQKIALDIDPNYANAYYGLALIYGKWGDGEAAKRSWQEYLRIEPSGFYSRRAREAIQSLDRKP